MGTSAEKPKTTRELLHEVTLKDVGKDWFPHPEAKRVCGRIDEKISIRNDFGYFQHLDRGKRVYLETFYVELREDGVFKEWIPESILVMENDAQMRERLREEGKDATEGA
jgi:hypothetical protein